MPSVAIVMPYFASVYPVWAPSQRGVMFRGGDSDRMCGFSASFRIGTAARLSMNVPRTLTSCMRSYFFAARSSEPDRSITEALLTTMSMPPNSPCVFITASVMSSSLRTSPTIGSARPPAASMASAAEWTVPSSFGCGVSVFAMSAMFAPSRAARSAIARPMPRLPPDIRMVFPVRVTVTPWCFDGMPRRTLPHALSIRGCRTARRSIAPRRRGSRRRRGERRRG